MTHAALLAALTLTAPPASEPDRELLEYNRRRIRTSKTGMYTLGGWGVANIATGIAGNLVADGRLKFFNQMNWMWNTVNLAIAIPGLVRAYRADPREGPRATALAGGRSSVRIFAWNLVLDLAYVGTGAFLSDYGTSNDHDRLSGYGQSVMLQGAFLLVFDTAMLAINHRHNRRFEPLVLTDRRGASLGLTGAF